MTRWRPLTASPDRVGADLAERADSRSASAPGVASKRPARIPVAAPPRSAPPPWRGVARSARRDRPARTRGSEGSARPAAGRAVPRGQVRRSRAAATRARAGGGRGITDVARLVVGDRDASIGSTSTRSYRPRTRSGASRNGKFLLDRRRAGGIGLLLVPEPIEGGRAAAARRASSWSRVRKPIDSQLGVELGLQLVAAHRLGPPSGGGGRPGPPRGAAVP